MTKRPIRGWAQQDAFTGWRKMMCYLKRAGATSSIKREARRRERHDAKKSIRKDEE